MIRFPSKRVAQAESRLRSLVWRGRYKAVRIPEGGWTVKRTAKPKH